MSALASKVLCIRYGILIILCFLFLMCRSQSVRYRPSTSP